MTVKLVLKSLALAAAASTALLAAPAQAQQKFVTIGTGGDDLARRRFQHYG